MNEKLPTVTFHLPLCSLKACAQQADCNLRKGLGDNVFLCMLSPNTGIRCDAQRFHIIVALMQNGNFVDVRMIKADGC